MKEKKSKIYTKEMNIMSEKNLGFLEVEEVEFDEEKYKKNLEENDFSAKETYVGESKNERDNEKDEDK